MLCRLYRAQNESLISSIGLAWSYDGYNFTRYNQPVFFPTEPYERNGTEDPRLVRVNGTFYMTYTGFNGSQAQLCMATSENLVDWQRHGPILPYNTDVVYSPEENYNRPREGWSKSGAIAPEKINGLYQMQWGDSYLYTANSTDLIHWNYVSRTLHAVTSIRLIAPLCRPRTTSPSPNASTTGRWA